MNNKLYYSNNGKGPGIARIIECTEDSVTFEYKAKEKQKRWKEHTLSLTAFLQSGWKMRRKKIA